MLRVPFLCKFRVRIKEEFNYDFKSNFFFVAIVGLHACYEFHIDTSSKFISKRNSAMILNQLYFSIAIAELDASSKFHFYVSFELVSKRNSTMILNQTFFLLSLLDLMHVTSSTLIRVRVSIKDEFSYDFKSTFFYCHCWT